MKLFDLHCDTIEELRDHGEDFAHHHRQFDIQDIQHCDGGVQTMAVFVPDHIRGQAAKDFVDDYYHYMNDAVSKVSHLAQMVEQVEDIQRITSEHKWAFLRSIESGACFNQDLDNINHFASLNFKMCGLVRKQFVFFHLFSSHTNCHLAEKECLSSFLPYYVCSLLFTRKETKLRLFSSLLYMLSALTRKETKLLPFLPYYIYPLLFTRKSTQNCSSLLPCTLLLPRRCRSTLPFDITLKTDASTILDSMKTRPLSSPLLERTTGVSLSIILPLRAAGFPVRPARSVRYDRTGRKIR